MRIRLSALILVVWAMLFPSVSVTRPVHAAVLGDRSPTVVEPTRLRSQAFEPAVLATGVATRTFTNAVALPGGVVVFTLVGPMRGIRYFHTATLLPDGRVLVAGGLYYDASSAELYDPATGAWSRTGSLSAVRNGPTATLLPNGKVLIAGGGSAELGTYYPASLYLPLITRLGR